MEREGGGIEIVAGVESIGGGGPELLAEFPEVGVVGLKMFGFGACKLIEPPDILRVIPIGI